MRGTAIAIGAVAVFATCSAVNASAEAAPASAKSAFDELVTSPTLPVAWVGARSWLVEKGVTFDANLTQITQGVVDGGKDASWQYGGRGDLTGNLDTQKLGLWPGGFLTVELEWNWSNSVNGSTGALIPANTNQLFPLPSGDKLGLPNLSFAQFLSPYAGVTIGKFNTLSGDANEFAHGAHAKGDTQFFNTAFNINPVTLIIPYSTLGGGAIVLPTKDPNEAIIKLLVISATGNATTAGFDDLDSDNLVFTMEGRVRTGFFSLTGHQLVGAYYSNRAYTSIDQRLGFVLDNQALARKRDTWAVYYNFDQFLYEIDKEAGRGVGLFGRFGASEGTPNPAQYVFSFGVGGKGMFASRELDRFGIGYYYIIVNNPTFQRPLTTNKLLEDEWGFEIFYNVALTPWMLLTPDIQVIGPAQKTRITGLVARKSVDVATILGVRLQLVF
jgi:porin